MTERYDVAIIGSGPGGYVAAIRSAQLGFKTVCIEQYSVLGGTCLNVGCIPSKTLLNATEFLLHLQQESDELGFDSKNSAIDFSKLGERKKKVVKSLTDGIAGIFKRRGVVSLQGKAEFIDPHRLLIRQDGEKTAEIEASYILIATGSEPISLPNIPFHEHQIVSSTGALNLTKVPSRLAVIGGGVIGVELASVYCRLGSQVTIIEMLDHICPPLEAQMSKSLMQLLKKQGMTFLLSSRVASVVVQPDEVILTIEHGDALQNLSANTVLVSVGRRPFTKGLKLENAGIELDKKGLIPINERFQTRQSHIYAIGDVIEGPMLAHRASSEGVAAIDTIKGIPSAIHYLSIPNVIYTYPEAATVGLTEKEAVEAGLTPMIGNSYFRGNARARCSGEMDGFVKIVGDKTSGRLLGMHILGPHASELISEGMIAMQKGMKVQELADAVQAHPTLSEAIKEAALDALGRPIH